MYLMRFIGIRMIQCNQNLMMVLILNKTRMTARYYNPMHLVTKEAKDIAAQVIIEIKIFLIVTLNL